MNKNVAIGWGLGALELVSAIAGYGVGSKICRSFGVGGLKRIIFSVALGHFVNEEISDFYMLFIPDDRGDAIVRDFKAWLEGKLGLKKKPHIVED